MLSCGASVTSKVVGRCAGEAAVDDITRCEKEQADDERHLTTGPGRFREGAARSVDGIAVDNRKCR